MGLDLGRQNPMSLHPLPSLTDSPYASQSYISGSRQAVASASSARAKEGRGKAKQGTMAQVRMKTDGKNSVPFCPYFYIYSACFCIYGKTRKWNGKREGVYPARICGIPFLAGIIPYFSRIYKIQKNK